MGNKRKNTKELRSRGRSRDISEKAIMVKRGTCARAKRRRRSGKFDSASNMFDDTAQPQLVRCISSPKMGQPIKRQVQGDRRFRRRQQRRDSNTNRAAAATLTTWSEISTILANWTKVIRERDRDSDINCEPPPKLQCNRWIVFWQSRVQANFECKWTNHESRHQKSAWFLCETLIKTSFGKRNLQKARANSKRWVSNGGL